MYKMRSRIYHRCLLRILYTYVDVFNYRDYVWRINVSMGKIKVLAVLEVEEGLFTDKSEHLKAEDVDINIGQDMLVSFSGLQIDLYHRDVRMNGNKIALTDLEFRLLHYLASQPGRVFSYQQIYEAVWGEEYAREKGNIMSHIRHIRQKLEVAGDSFDYIENIRGVGYRFKKPVTDSSQSVRYDGNCFKRKRRGAPAKVSLSSQDQI